MALSIFKKPQCLIENDKDGRLQVVPQCIEELNQLDKPFVVVSIAGLYRTGKSYLMNRLFGKSEGKIFIVLRIPAIVIHEGKANVIKHCTSVDETGSTEPS